MLQNFPPKYVQFFYKREYTYILLYSHHRYDNYIHDLFTCLGLTRIRIIAVWDQSTLVTLLCAFVFVYINIKIMYFSTRMHMHTLLNYILNMLYKFTHTYKHKKCARKHIHIHAHTYTLLQAVYN